MLLSLLALSTAASSQPLSDFNDAKAQADRDEASLDPLARAALLESQERLLQAGVSACATPNPDVSPFVVVMETDSAGIVVRTWLQGTSPLAVCFRKQAQGMRLSAPARAAFHSSIERSFTP